MCVCSEHLTRHLFEDSLWGPIRWLSYFTRPSSAFAVVCWEQFTLFLDWGWRQKWLERCRRHGRLQLGQQVRLEREVSFRSLFHPRLPFREKAQKVASVKNCFEMMWSLNLNVLKFSKHCTQKIVQLARARRRRISRHCLFRKRHFWHWKIAVFQMFHH